MAVTESCCATHVPDDYIPTAPAERVATPLAIDGLHNCGIERVEFEWTVDNERSFTILPFITDALYHLSYTYLLTDSEGAVAIRFKEDDPPIVLPPRAYLTLLTTLLI